MIIADTIELKNKIGKGAFGAVFIGKDRKDGTIYAVKKVSKELLLSETMKAYFNNEIYFLKHFSQHPNIVKYYDIKHTLSNYYVILEYCNGGNLETALNKYICLNDKPFTEDLTRYILNQILKGLYYLNSNDIIHRDIKAENILLQYDQVDDLSENNIFKANVKIIDFGFARFLKNNELASTLIGTPLFMDPSILSCITKEKSTKKKDAAKKTNKTNDQKGFYDMKSDIWSLGIVAYQLLLGVLPFNGESCEGLLNCVNKRNYTFPQRKITLSRKAIEFLDTVLNVDANIRPTAGELMENEWLKGNYNSNDLFILKNENEINRLSNSDRFSFFSFWKEVTPLPVLRTKSLRIDSLQRKGKIENFLLRIRKVKNINAEMGKMQENVEIENGIVKNPKEKPNGCENQKNVQIDIKYQIEKEKILHDYGTPIKNENHGVTIQY